VFAEAGMRFDLDFKGIDSCDRGRIDLLQITGYNRVALSENWQVCFCYEEWPEVPGGHTGFPQDRTLAPTVELTIQRALLNSRRAKSLWPLDSQLDVASTELLAFFDVASYKDQAPPEPFIKQVLSTVRSGV
jgi:hypothetical protein